MPSFCCAQCEAPEKTSLRCWSSRTAAHPRNGGRFGHSNRSDLGQPSVAGDADLMARDGGHARRGLPGMRLTAAQLVIWIVNGVFSIGLTASADAAPETERVLDALKKIRPMEFFIAKGAP